MYTDVQKKFRIENLELWEGILLDVFEGTIPEHAEWSVRNEIVEVINKIGIKNLNHMLYPDNGGLDVVGCNVSDLGSDMIEILTAGNTPNLCNPLKLIFDI